MSTGAHTSSYKIFMDKEVVFRIHIQGWPNSRRAISLVDCFTLALGEEMEVPVMFAVKERELVREIRRKPFKIPVIFLEDLIESQNLDP